MIPTLFTCMYDREMHDLAPAHTHGMQQAHLICEVRIEESSKEGGQKQPQGIVVAMRHGLLGCKCGTGKVLRA